MATQQERVDKIAKLIAKAHDPAIAEAEAETYLSHAIKLMARHSITQDMIDRARGVRSDITELRITMPGPLGEERALLCSFIAAAVHCRTVLLKPKGKMLNVDSVIVIGMPRHVQRAAELFELLGRQAQHGVLTEPVPKWFSEYQRDRFRSNWVKQFAVITARRLADIEARAVAEHVRETTPHFRAPASGLLYPAPSAVLVVRDTENRVRDYYQEKYGNVSPHDHELADAGDLGTMRGSTAGLHADIGLTGLEGS